LLEFVEASTIFGSGPWIGWTAQGAFAGQAPYVEPNTNHLTLDPNWDLYTGSDADYAQADGQLMTVLRKYTGTH